MEIIMNFKFESIVKIISLAVLAAAFGQSAQAMEMSHEEDFMALIDAAGQGNITEVIRLLGIDANSQQELDEALLRATQYGNTTEVAQLLERGADINCKDNFLGEIPLHNAYYNNDCLKMAKLLINHGANINCKNNRGATPLHSAIAQANWDYYNKCLGITKLLIDHGADINCKDNRGWSPLHEACYRRKLEMAKLLIDHGADINYKDNRGQTALDVANQYEYIKMVELLTNESQRRKNHEEEQALLLERLKLSKDSRVLSAAYNQAQIINPTLAQSIQEQHQHNDSINNNLALLACGLPRK
jgi:ankyrin repeat protein